MPPSQSLPHHHPYTRVPFFFGCCCRYRFQRTMGCCSSLMFSKLPPPVVATIINVLIRTFALFPSTVYEHSFGHIGVTNTNHKEVVPKSGPFIMNIIATAILCTNTTTRSDRDVECGFGPSTKTKQSRDQTSSINHQPWAAKANKREAICR
jgi:hypothetical protein